VEDVAKATVLLMESSASGERFILNGDNWTFQQLFNSIADGLEKKRPHKHATPLLGNIAWRVEKLKSLFTGKKPLLTKQSAIIAQCKTRFDNSKVLKQLPGFFFTPLTEVIEKSCEKYLHEAQPS